MNGAFSIVNFPQVVLPSEFAGVGNWIGAFQTDNTAAIYQAARLDNSRIVHH